MIFDDPLLLLIEAPPQEKDPAAGADAKPDAIEPPTDDTADIGAKGDEPPPDDPSADDGAGDGTGEDDPLGDDEEDDDLGGDGAGGEDDGAAGDGTDAGDGAPPVDPAKKEALFDAMFEMRETCRTLLRSIDAIAGGIENEDLSRTVARARQLVDEAERQSSMLLSRFTSFDYEKARSLFQSVKERVSSVSEVIKHVIDGDDDSRDPGPNKS